MPPRKKDVNLLDVIVEFLKKNVNGKTLYTDEISYTLENGRLSVTYSDQISLSNMFFSKVRCTMDMFVVSKERIADTETGKIVSDKYTSSLYRRSFAYRRSTGNVSGVLIHLSSSDMSGPVPEESTVSITYRAKFEKNGFSWIEDQMSYRDMFCADGGYRPVAFRTKCRLFLEDGVLVYEHEPECFEVNAETLARTPSDEKYPMLISKERRM